MVKADKNSWLLQELGRCNLPTEAKVLIRQMYHQLQSDQHALNVAVAKGAGPESAEYGALVDTEYVIRKVRSSAR